MTTTAHTNGTGSIAPLHYPGALTDAQAARFNGRGESTNRVFYEWHRSEESSLAEFMAERTPAAESEIAQLVATVRQAADEMEALEEKVQTAKDRLRYLLSQRGENWQDSDGYARLMKDSTRTAYDAKALDELILTNKWFSRLRKYRREFTVRGGVQVK